MEGAGSIAHVSNHQLPYLSQHLVILDVIELLGADFPLQGVLVVFSADVDQQRGGTGLHLAAQRHVVDIAGDVDAVAQDHTDQDPWGGTGVGETSQGKLLG